MCVAQFNAHKESARSGGPVDIIRVTSRARLKIILVAVEHILHPATQFDEQFVI